MRFLSTCLAIGALSLFSLSATPLAAQQGWIGDTVFVPVRAGAGSGFRILHRGLRTGTAVEILEFEEGAEWAQIRVGDIEGFVSAQYLLRTPPAAIRLEQLQRQHEQVRQQLAEARQQVSALTNERNQLSAEARKLSGELATQSSEVSRLEEVAADPIRLDRANRELNEELSTLRTRLDTVQAENALLRSDNTSSKWMIGALILLGGGLLGWILKSNSSRNRSSWS